MQKPLRGCLFLLATYAKVWGIFLSVWCAIRFSPPVIEFSCSIKMCVWNELIFTFTGNEFFSMSVFVAPSISDQQFSSYFTIYSFIRTFMHLLFQPDNLWNLLNLYRLKPVSKHSHIFVSKFFWCNYPVLFRKSTCSSSESVC